MMHWGITNREYKKKMRRQWTRLRRQLYGGDGAMVGCAFVPEKMREAMNKASLAIHAVCELGAGWWKNA